MEALVGLGLFAVVAILFYRFVERRHKILLFKIAGGLTVVFGLVIGGYFAFDHWKNNRKRAWLSAKFSTIYEKSSQESEHQAAERGYADTKKQYEWFLGSLSSKQESFVKVALLSRFLDTDRLGVSYNDLMVPPGNPKIAELRKAEIALVNDYFNEKIAKDEFDRKREAVEVQQIDEYALEMNKWGETDNLEAFRAFTWHNSVSEAHKKSLLLKVPTPQLEAMKTVTEMHKAARKSVFDALNADSIFQTLVSLNVCNHRNVPLLSAEIRIAGIVEGRSTKNAVVKGANSYDDDTKFNSDIIIKPDSCMDIQWTGAYKFFDDYKVTYVGGQWEDKESMYTYEPTSPRPSDSMGAH